MNKRGQPHRHSDKMTEAYRQGFLTKCAEYGLSRDRAIGMLKKADGVDPRLIGGLIGAAAGGLAGAAADRKRRLRGALLGMLGGGAVGFGLGAQHRYLENKNVLDAQSREKMQRDARETAERNARISRRDAIGARLAEKGITGITPDGNSDADIDWYAYQANNEIARRSSKMLSLPAGFPTALNPKEERIILEAHPELADVFRRAIDAKEEASKNYWDLRNARIDAVRAGLKAKGLNLDYSDNIDSKKYDVYDPNSKAYWEAAKRRDEVMNSTLSDFEDR